MIWLAITLLTLLVGLNLVSLVYLWRASLRLSSISQSLHSWDQPQTLAQPLQEPGSTWAVSDGELAALESQWSAQSLERGTVLGHGSKGSRSSSRRKMA